MRSIPLSATATNDQIHRTVFRRVARRTEHGAVDGEQQTVDELLVRLFDYDDPGQNASPAVDSLRGHRGRGDQPSGRPTRADCRVFDVRDRLAGDGRLRRAANQVGAMEVHDHLRHDAECERDVRLVAIGQFLAQFRAVAGRPVLGVLAFLQRLQLSVFQ